MLILLADGSRRAQSNISEVGVSTKPARSLEKSSKDSAITGLAGRDPYACCRAVAIRPVGGSFDPVFLYQFARPV